MINIKDTLFTKKKFFTKKKIIISIVVFIVLFILINIIGAIVGPKISYKTTLPNISDVTNTISATGIINPTNEVLIGTVTSGLVLEVNVDVNDIVKKGDILATINPESINQEIEGLKAKLNSANASLKISQRTLEDKKWHYQKLESLYKKTGGKSPSRLELQNAKTTYVSALNDVEVKQASIKELDTSLNASYIKLKNSVIVSPIDGVVLARSVEVGQTIAASFNAPELFKVAQNLEEMNLIINISEADIGKVAVGQEVRFSVDAYPDKSFNAKINRVNYGSSTVENIVSYETEIYVDNKELLLKPGMSATAEIIIEEAKDVLNVPTAALYFDLEKSLNANTESKKSSSPLGMMGPPKRAKKVIKSSGNISKEGTLWVLQDNKPQQISVTTGLSDGQNTQIIDGLGSDAQVITSIEKK